MRLLILVIDLLVMGNLLLFVVVLSLLVPPPTLVRSFIHRFQDREDPVYPPDAAETMIRNIMRFYGFLGCGALFGWTVLTSFVVFLYVGGVLPTFIRNVLR